MSGKDVTQLDFPRPPLSGWKVVDEREPKMLNQFLLSLQVQFLYNTGIIVTVNLSDIVVISIIAIITFMIRIL